MPRNDFPSCEIHVWQATSNAELADELRPAISNAECQRAQRFRHAEDAQQFVVARGVLRTIVGHYLDQPSRNVQFCYGSTGKPEVADDSRLQFNVSHSGGMVLVAIANEREVGVDVERINRVFEFESLAAHFFSPSENAALQKIPADMRRRAFFLTWSRKEALLKAKGEGLAALRNEFQLPVLSDPLPKALRVMDREQSKWLVTDLPCGDDYAAAVAVRGFVMQPRLRPWQEIASSRNQQ